MAAHRKSKIWKISKEEFLGIINNSSSFKEALNHFDLENKGENFKTLRKRMFEDGINFTHFQKRGGHKPSPLETILTENSNCCRTHLKKKLLKQGILKNECYSCGQLPIWNDKPLSLQLDHINGISNDNRIENLRILCPHCHSQTDNFAGKNKKLGK